MRGILLVNIIMGVPDCSYVRSEQSSNQFSYTGTTTTVNVTNRHADSADSVIRARCLITNSRHASAAQLLRMNLL